MTIGCGVLFHRSRFLGWDDCVRSLGLICPKSSPPHCKQLYSALFYFLCMHVCVHNEYSCAHMCMEDRGHSQEMSTLGVLFLVFFFRHSVQLLVRIYIHSHQTKTLTLSSKTFVKYILMESINLPHAQRSGTKAIPGGENAQG